MTHTYFTTRLAIRHWKECDAPALFKLASDPEIGPIAEWVPHRNVEESLNIIRNVFIPQKEFYAVLRSSDKTLIGCVGLILGNANVPLAENEAEIGYWIGRNYWHQGYATEAAEWMLEQGFSRLGLRTIFATCASVNARSVRLLRRLNFKFIGNRMSDNALVDEYQPQKVWKFSKNQQTNQTNTNNYRTAT